MGAVQSACEGCFSAKDTENLHKSKPNSSAVHKEAKDNKAKYQDFKTSPPGDPNADKQSLGDQTSSLNHETVKKGIKLTKKDFEKKKLLGEGSFGKVFFAQRIKTKKFYALKVLQKDRLLKNGNADMALTEKHVLQTAAHPFIVKLHYSFQDETKLFYVMDFCAGGELFTHLKRKGKFDEATTRFYLAEVVSGLEYLHNELNIIYRDLKPENLLLNANGHIKITDFGLSKETKIGKSFCGTPEYLAPEILLGNGYDRTVDWWSLGCLAYEMLTGIPPFSNRDRDQLFKQILKGQFTIPLTLSKDARDLITKLLTRNFRERLGFNGAAEIKSHPFFASVNFEDLVNLKINPPYVPNLTKIDDLSNFDKYYLKAPIPETPKGNGAVLGQNEFAGFTYVRQDLGGTTHESKLF